jgi:cell shape-determining protein MreC
VKLVSFRSQNKQRRVLMGVVLLVALALVEYVGALSPVEDVLVQALQPLQAAQIRVIQIAKAPVRSLLLNYQSAEHLQELQEQHAVALAELAQLQTLRRENEALKELLENTNRTLEERRVAVPVVSLSYPAVAAGSENGVVEGSMVTYKDVLLGVVTEVSAHQSRVALLSSKDSIPVLAKTDSGVMGIVTGNGKRALLTEIPRDDEIVVGEKVTTMGQPGIRRGILVGTVSSIDTRPSAPTQTAVLEQLVSFHEAPVVEIW